MSRKTKRTNIVLEIMFWLLSITVVYPILMVIITSLKPQKEANYLNIRLPSEWMFSNYAKVWEEGDVLQAFGNSIVITLFSVMLIIILAAMFSYALVRRDSISCRRISKIMTFGIIAPFAAMPTMELLKGMGIYGSRTSLVLVYGALYMPFTCMLISSFIKGLPRELDEAAVVDGCKGTKLFVTIILPLLKPVLATAAVLNFMWVWNDLQTPMYLLNSSDKWTLPLSVYNFYGQFNRSWHLVCADMVLVSIPVILLYIFAQKYIVAGMTAGAIKG